MLVYIASEVELPTIPWDPANPAFHVDRLADATGSSEVAERFSMPYIYQVGSAEKCACAFEAGSDREPHEEADREAAVQELRRYLGCVAARSPIELYACWAGHEHLPPIHEEILVLEEDAFSFESRTFLRLPQSAT